MDKYNRRVIKSQVNVLKHAKRGRFIVCAFLLPMP